MQTSFLIYALWAGHNARWVWSEFDWQAVLLHWWDDLFVVACFKHSSNLVDRFWDTPVVKSSSRELCYIILAGICLGYLCTFSLIAKPHIIYCYLQRLGIGLSPAMSYSALVTKVSSSSWATVGQRSACWPWCTTRGQFPHYLGMFRGEGVWG